MIDLIDKIITWAVTVVLAVLIIIGLSWYLNLDVPRQVHEPYEYSPTPVYNQPKEYRP